MSDRYDFLKDIIKNPTTELRGLEKHARDAFLLEQLRRVGAQPPTQPVAGPKDRIPAGGFTSPPVDYLGVSKPTQIPEPIVKGIEALWSPFELGGQIVHSVVKGTGYTPEEKKFLDNYSTIYEGTNKQIEDLIRTGDLTKDEGSEYMKALIDTRNVLQRGEQERYRALPTWEKLISELPLLIATGGMGLTATQIRASLAPTAARGGVPGALAQTGRIGLAPLAGVEYATGQILTWTIGKPLSALFGKIGSARTAAAWHKTPFYQGMRADLKGTPFEKDMASAFNLWRKGNSEQAETVMNNIFANARAGRYGGFEKAGAKPPKDMGELIKGIPEFTRTRTDITKTGIKTGAVTEPAPSLTAMQRARAELTPEVPSQPTAVTPPQPPAQPVPETPQPISEGYTEPSGVIPQPSEAVPPPEVISAEDIAVTEVSGVPPKPPKDWGKIGGQLYDDFKGQSSDPTPNTIPAGGKAQRAWGGVEKVTTDEFARLNRLGWEAELDVAMVRAADTQSSQLYRETMLSIRNSLNNDSDLLTHVDDYLTLRHQLEVLKATGRKYFTIKKGTTTKRFTANQIGLIFQQMKSQLGAENYGRVKEAASHVPAVYNQILKDTQELTQKQIDGLIKKYPWYNPILFKNDTVPANINSKLSSRQVRELTSLESDKENISPLLSLPSTIAKRMKAQAINTARKSVAELAVDPKNAQLIGGGVEIVTQKPGGLSIDYFENGERKYLKLGKGSEWLAQDIELLQRQPPHAVISMVRSLQNLSKMFFTTYNPGFVAWNTAFDGMVAYFSEGIGPWGFGKALAGNIKGMFADVPGLNEFKRSGGEMFGFFEKGRMGEEAVVTPYIAKEGGRLVLKNPESLKRLINPFTLIRELGVAGENAARRATYEKTIEEGLTPKEAALRARRVTVDFTRFSAASRIINDWFIYFNPATQGLLVPGRAIAKNPRSLWRLGALIAGYMALTFYNQGYDEYDDVRDSDKVGKLLIMLPSDEYNKYGQKVPHYLTLLPFREFAVFTAPLEYLMGRLRTEEPEAYRSLAQEWGALYPIITPLSMISETGGIVMPTQIGATIQQIQQNHDDFRDRPIVDDEMELLPPAEQYDQYTNAMAIRIGQALNMSPKKLDFFVSNMFGALGGDCLRAVDSAIRVIDKEAVDERIAGLVDELRTIPTEVPPNQIEVARETFLEGLSTEDRQLVLNMERMPDDKIPLITGIVRRFFKDYGGQVYATAKEKALASRTLDDYPPEALEELQGAAVENANNLLSGKITKYQYDQSRSRYRAYYSGTATAEWRQSMIEGAVARADVDKFAPESYQRSKEFQAVSAYMEISGGLIDKAGGVLDSDTWDEIEQVTFLEMKKHYSEAEIQYALAHKDDWIDKLPEPARTTERQRARGIEDETWWDNYRGGTTTFNRPGERSSAKDMLGLNKAPSALGERSNAREMLGIK